MQLLAGCLVAGGVAAAPVPEFELKAAFVYNFALFTDWPAETPFEAGMLNLCVHPYSAMRPALSSLNDRMIKGRKIAVRQLALPDGIRGCHLFFADAADRERWPQIRKALGNAPVLTISDDMEIGHDGSIVSLSSEGSRIVFDIDLRAARNARLVLSSKLLRLARSVQ
ncbi:YfiR family protein [Noviherbaspirillum aerium]|uniref:YfiR family protein n=1 Tax=Noviherbaspirillum aerium TaxID=2588497 RepID=UPI00178C7918|nr:YfiR family protein [Noviherbaspirillum aerium]